ncbi:MAG TPA: DUF3299 domain-containing protein [Pirellulales bacterium]|jgi:hypothetical protein|nr:DUF3299 domain-containing protein [Pirellulales bacterium]
MSVDVRPRPVRFAPEADEALPYRAVSRLAVLSLALGLFSAVALLDWPLAIVPAVGIVSGLVAWRHVRWHDDTLTGAVLARWGIALSAVFWTAGWGRLSYEYATEIPPGYQRLTFAELQPDPARPDEAIPPAARAADGKRVFLKGYVLPGRQTEGIQEFVLVWTSGDCCFGSDPLPTHMVAVTLDEPLRLSYTTRLRKVAGTFHVEPGSADGKSVVYKLQADYLQ